MYILAKKKAKSILFGTKHKLRNAQALNIMYNATEIKQYEKVKYLGCILDQSLSGEPMALNVIDKGFSGKEQHFSILTGRVVNKTIHILSCKCTKTATS